MLVALSAGVDSTALLAALAAIRDAGGVAALFALHVDHGLRPDGAADAACAAASCARLGVPLERVRVVVRPGNVQAEARRVRYAALREAADRVGATRIATGHTRTDQAETVLLRLIRGAGARGISGVPPRRGRIVRPLLDRSREEGAAYLRALGIAWRDDPTNATPKYARNRLRQGAWAALARENPALEAALARAADLAREDERALVARGRRLLDPDGAVALADLQRAPVAVRRRAVRLLWRRVRGTGRGLAAHHVEAVLALCRRGRPGCVDLPHGIVARARYGRLALASAPRPEAPPEPVEVPGPGTFRVSARLEVEVRAGERAALRWPLVLRARRPGDRFRPAGGHADRKLKAWLIAERVPRERREALVVLAEGARILAIPELEAVAEEAAGLVVAVRPIACPDPLQRAH